MARTPRTTPAQLERARARTWIEGKVLDAMAPQIHKQHGKAKAAAIGAMTGTVVEIGPGTGANMRYYASGTHVIAIEPNANMHGPLREKAAEHDVDLEIRTLQGERIDVDDEAADGVVATLVLCGVDDPAAVVAEIRRVLQPGGTYFFLEHVGAPDGTGLRRVQDTLLRPHRWMFNGCEVNRDTAAVIESAGFSSVEHETIDAGLPGLYTRLQLVGTAVA